ncbi:MAG: DUF790 family protein [Magnetococcales bacterium]|nr:DUF790 family protein [Magnetococcales bacterium]
MLTRELLRFDQRQGRLTPRFVDARNQLLRDLARDMTAVYLSSEGQSRDEIAEAVAPLINAARSPLIAKGLNKLLGDRCVFREAPEGMEERRLEIFRMAGTLLQSAGMNDLPAYRRAVAHALDGEGDAREPDPDQLALGLHADHPDRQPLTGFDPLEPEALLHRYNLALAQGPLLWANRLTVHIRDPDPGKQRRFFRHLKFLQLLARLARDKDVEGGFTLELDGPLSLFDVQRKYGIKLALLLPELCQLREWRLQAALLLESRPLTFELSDASGLWAPEPRTGSYRPEEFEQFAAEFREKISAWEILPEAEILSLGGQELVVPDFSFRHASGMVVHLELFHRWHAGQLPARLKRLDGPGSHPPLALGVDRALGKHPSLVPLLEASCWFQEHGLPFNQFPPVKRVADALKGFLLAP